MIKILRAVRTFTKPKQQFQPEPWVESHIARKTQPHWKNSNQLPVKKFKDIKTTKYRGLRQGEAPECIQPSDGPFVVANPRMNKRYRWCACGMSLSQPFCDGSHQGSKFEPVKFQLLEEKQKIELCGCKRTKEAPWCDGESCTKK